MELSSFTDGRIVCHLPARQLIAPSAPSPIREFATARSKPKARKPKAPDVEQGRPLPGHGAGPFGCNPFALFNCLCLGPWPEFSWPRLIQCY